MRMRFVLGAAVFFLAAAAPYVWGAEAAPKDRATESEGIGARIDSDPSGAELYVDGILRGKTPLILSDLIAGTHVLRLEKDGYKARKALLNLPAGKHLSVLLELIEKTGIIDIRTSAASSPPSSGAFEPIVLIDGTRAALGANEVKEGFHTVSVRAFGYEEETRNVYAGEGRTEVLLIPLRPAAFRLEEARASRKRFNPHNAGLLGVTLITFNVSANGNADVTVRGKDGAVVFEKAIPSFTSWRQTVPWPGRDRDGNSLRDGTYTVIVSARSEDGRTELTEQMPIEIDSTLSVKPASIAGAIGGLLFAPDARTLPAASFQFESLVQFGYPYGASTAFAAPPSAFALRVAPLDDSTEAAGAFCLDPAQNGTALLSFAVSAKRLLIAAEGGGRPALSAALRWSCAETGVESPFGAPSGIELFLPAEYDLFRIGAAVATLRIAPALLWAGPKGIPDSAIPQLSASAGFSVAGSSWMIGISARTQADILGGAFSRGPILFGCEARFYPPPSVLYGTLIGGAWLSGEAVGAFGGAGIGITY